MTDLDWETVARIKALPERERRIYVELAIMQRPMSDVAAYHRATISQVERVYEEICRRLEAKP